MTKFDYDYFVIGGGSGGVRSARIAASHGARVAIAEGQHWGGTCVNVGCVPKKLLTYAADYRAAFEDSIGYGWSCPYPTFDWSALIANKDKEISRLNGIYKNLLQKAGVEAFEGLAHFADEHTIVVNDRTLTADKILIATGGTPRQPRYTGAEHTVTSDNVFYLNALPHHVVIEGGGYIAVEFAHIFHGLGAKVTIIYRGTHVLKEFDQDIGDFLTNEMQKQGVSTFFSTNITKIIDKNGQKIVVTDKNHEIQCDLVLSAIGREPNTGSLGLENVNLKRQDNGQIVTNDLSQTSIPHIYAVGDVTNHINLTPVAISEGHALADRLFGGMPNRKISYENIPTAIFSSPPIGTVGFSESHSREAGHDIDIYLSQFKPMRHTLSGRDERTLMKLVVERNTGKVLGAHMCGADAPEIMQGIGIALQCGATKADFDRTIGIHPTSAEEFVTMRSPSR